MKAWMKILAICCLALAPSPLSCGAEYLTDFAPSTVLSAHGPVTLVTFSTEMIELDPGLLAHHLPAAMRHFRFKEAVWIVGYKTRVVDAAGRSPGENYLCHTFLGDQRVMQSDDQELRGVYSDAFTPEVRLPDGFGIRFAKDETLHWMPMFNHRGDAPVRVGMRVELSIIRERDLKGSLKPLYGVLRSVQVPHLYFVAKGPDMRQSTFQFSSAGKIHFLGTHLHPYGVSVELFNLSSQQLVWRGVRRTDASGPTEAMEFFSSGEGYPVRTGESFRITAVYENTTEAPIDAMAGLFILYSRD